MDKPVLVEIIAYAPTAFYHCQHCEIVWNEIGFGQTSHQEQLESALPADLTQEYQAVSDWVHKIFKEHCDQVAVKVIDAASLEGFWKTLRYRAHHYPAIVIAGKGKYSGAGEQTFAAAEAEIRNQLQAVAS